MSSNETLTAVLPFAGFYESEWDAGLDMELEQMAEYERLHDAIDWRKAHESVARQYVTAFTGALIDDCRMEWAGAESIAFVFDRLDSPREYNFTTDRIFITADVSVFRSILDYVGRGNLAKKARELFTSRDGFASFYDPDIETWPADLSEWDHNQLYAILAAWPDVDAIETAAYESIACNGGFMEAIEQGMPQFETLCQIKAACDAGLPVRWKTDQYHVYRDSIGQYLITHKPNQHTVGLMHLDGIGSDYADSVCDFYLQH